MELLNSVFFYILVALFLGVGGYWALVPADWEKKEKSQTSKTSE